MVLTNSAALASCASWALQRGKMISGAHVILYSKNPDADRAFFPGGGGLRLSQTKHSTALGLGKISHRKTRGTCRGIQCAWKHE